MSEIKKTIQKNIALYRKKAGFTQKELAESISVPVTSLATWEQGKSLPDIDTLFSLCSALNVSILDISGFEPPNHKHESGNGTESAMSDMIEVINASNHHSAILAKELTNPISNEEEKLIDDYRKLNEQGKRYIRACVDTALLAYPSDPAERVLYIARSGDQGETRITKDAQEEALRALDESSDPDL